MTQNSADVSLTVDLVRQVIQTPWGESLAFEVDPLRKLSLLEGLDPIGVTLKSMAEIEAYEKQSERRQPWLWKSPALKA